MHRNLPIALITSLLSLLLGGPGCAAEQAAGAETKLREALRSTMLQLRDVQTQLANLQATQTELEEKNKSLDADFKALTKKTDAEKLESNKAVASLQSAIVAKDAEIGQLREVLEKARVAIEQKDRLQAATEEKRKALDESAIILGRRVTDQQVKNAAMYKIGLEILSRYEKFGLGDAISAREPFIGTTRVKFQNLVQDFQDKLTEQKIKPANDAPPGRPPAATGQSAAKGKAPSQTSKKKPEPQP